MSKYFLLVLIIFFTNCQTKSQNGVNKEAVSNPNITYDTIHEKIEYPLSIIDIETDNTPYFKIFKGEIEGKNITLLLRSSYGPGPFRANDGYYYFDDEKKIIRLDGDYFGVGTRETNNVGDWEVRLDDMFNSISVSEDINNELSRYGFSGWVTRSGFWGIFAHPYLKPNLSNNLHNYYSYYSEIVKGHITPISLPEIKSAFSNFSNIKKISFSIEGSTLDSLEINYSVTLPEGMPELKQMLLEGVSKKEDNYNLSAIKFFERDALEYMKKESDIVKAFKKNKNKEYNSILFYYDIQLPYTDKNLICFKARKNISYNPTKNQSHRNYLIEDTVKYVNYDIQTKMFLKTEDVFLDNSYESVRNIVNNSDDMIKFKSDESELSFAMKPLNINAFFLTTKGISFEFPKTPNYQSEVYIFVPYEDLSKYLTPTFKGRIAKWQIK